MKILFRTSGGMKKDLGLGHIYRCLNLSHYIKRSNDLHFMIEDYGNVEQIIKEKGYENIISLKKDIPIKFDIAKTIQYILNKKIDVVIIDKYKINKQYVEKIKKFVKVILITGLRNNIDYDADLIVNGFIGYKNKIVRNKYGTKCLLGPAYQILNHKYAKKTMSTKKKYDLLATFGGFDSTNIVTVLMKVLLNHKRIKTKIILGAATKKTKEIHDMEQKHKKYLSIVEQTFDMRKEISQTHFGICAGGITTYEFSAMQVPFAIVCQYEHQIITAREWQKKKIAKNLGFIQGNEKKLDILLSQLVQNKIHLKSQKIIDGLGSKRVATEILKMVKK